MGDGSKNTADGDDLFASLATLAHVCIGLRTRMYVGMGNQKHERSGMGNRYIRVRCVCYAEQISWYLGSLGRGTDSRAGRPAAGSGRQRRQSLWPIRAICSSASI